MIGWDHPATAERYERYNRRHARYRRANEVLVREAELAPGLRVLDVGAGTGRTAAAALPSLGRGGSVICVEPARAMRAVGMHRLIDSRVEWRAELPSDAETFDRVLCGAAIWQMTPLDTTIHKLASLLRPGGALVFDIPALYLGQPDEPGGGRDPLLLDLLVSLSAVGCQRSVGAASSSTEDPATALRAGWPTAGDGFWSYDPAGIDALLRAAGLEPRGWEFRLRLTQTAWAHWMTIPVLTDRLLPGISPENRDRIIETALTGLDRRSFKWERWRGWTAWKS